MPNIATALKSEISRLARKVIRAEVDPLKKTVAQQRTHIAALRRQFEALERSVKRTSKVTKRAEASSTPGDKGLVLRFRASGLASHRKRLGLSAADFGSLLGVSGQSVYKWEAGEVKPRRSQLQAIAEVRKLGRREAEKRLAALG
jgi:DNA-binding transcriptional regulator YiaG